MRDWRLDTWPVSPHKFKPALGGPRTRARHAAARRRDRGARQPAARGARGVPLRGRQTRRDERRRRHALRPLPTGSGEAAGRGGTGGRGGGGGARGWADHVGPLPTRRARARRRRARARAGQDGRAGAFTGSGISAVLAPRAPTPRPRARAEIRMRPPRSNRGGAAQVLPRDGLIVSLSPSDSLRCSNELRDLGPDHTKALQPLVVGHHEPVARKQHLRDAPWPCAR